MTEKAQSFLEVFEKRFDVKVTKVVENLGLVFGWAIISKIDGEPYYDLQNDHIPEDTVIKSATEFMLSGRTAKEMHVGEAKGVIVFAFPMITDIAEAFGITTKQTGLMIGMRPDSRDVLEKYRTGEYTGFSVGGLRLEDEEVA